MKVRIPLPIQLPTPNQILRMSIRQQTQLKKDYQLLLNVVWEPKYRQPEGERRRVEIISYRKKLLTDDDNLRFMGKFLTDALVKSGFITDDSRTYIDHVVTQKTDRENPRTEILIRTI